MHIRKRIFPIAVAVIMVLTSFVPTFAAAGSSPEKGGPTLSVSGAEKGHEYQLYSLTVTDPAGEQPAVWEDSLAKNEEFTKAFGEAEDFTALLEDILSSEDPEELLLLQAKELQEFLDPKQAIEPSDEHKYSDLSAGTYILADEEGYYIPQFIFFDDEDVEAELAADPEQAEQAEDKEKDASQGAEKDEPKTPKAVTDGNSDGSDKAQDADVDVPDGPKAKTTAKKAPLRAGSTALQSFSAEFARGASLQDGKYVWEADNSTEHRFTYRVNYAAPATEDIEAGALEIRIPASLFNDRRGSIADEYDIAAPEEDDADDDSVFVYRKDGNELVLTNHLAIEAGERGSIEVAYILTKHAMNYVDMEPSGTFTAECSLGGNTDTVSADPVYINTNVRLFDVDCPPSTPLFYTKWQSEFGEKPQDADDYYYLVWTVKSKITECLQYYDFSLNVTVSDGDIARYKMEGVSGYTDIHSVSDVAPRNNERFDKVITRLPKSEYENRDFTVSLKASATLTPADGKDSASVRETTKNYSYKLPVFNVPTGNTGFRNFGTYSSSYPIATKVPERPDSNGIVRDEADISDYGLTEFKEGETDRLNSETLRFYAFLNSDVYYPTAQGYKTSTNTAGDPSSYGVKDVTYELKGDGFSLEDEPLAAGDYEISKLHFSLSSIKQKLDPDTQTFVQAELTAQDDAAFQIYAKKDGDSDFVKIAEYSPYEKSWKNVDMSYVGGIRDMDLTLTPGVLDYKVSVTDPLFKHYIRAYPHITIFRNAHILSLVEGKSKVCLSENVKCGIYDFEGEEIYPLDETTTKGELFRDGLEGRVYIAEVQKESHLTKSVTGTRNNKKKKTFTVTWNIRAEEIYTDNDGVHFTEQGGGTFYDLCPSGSHPDKESVSLYSGRNELGRSEYTVEVKSNYKGSGRDLLIVRTDASAENYNLRYDTVHAWEDLTMYSTSVFNTVAYETGNSKITDGSLDNGGNTSDAKYLAGLDPDSNGKRFLYKQKWYDIDIVTATLSGITKRVKSEDSDTYEKETTVSKDTQYTYRLKYKNDSNTARKGLVFFDSLENYSTQDISSQWKGTLQSVDVSALKEKGINAAVYYSDIPDLDITLHRDLEEVVPNTGRVWKQEVEFGDVGRATAVAVDCTTMMDGTDCVIGIGDAAAVYINMMSPSRVPVSTGLSHTYNNVYVASKDMDNTEHFTEQAYTSVAFRVTGDVEFEKVSSESHDKKISGISFKLTGVSDYGTEISEETASTANGHVEFRGIERGTYQLREKGGSDDWLLDTDVKTVVIDEDGETTINGLEKDGIINRYYVWENTPRIHGDINIFKKEKGVRGEGKLFLKEVASLHPGDSVDLSEVVDSSDESITALEDHGITGITLSKGLVVSENGNLKTIALGINNRTTKPTFKYAGIETFDIDGWRWSTSNLRNALNTQLLNLFPDVADYIIPTTAKTAVFTSTGEYIGIDTSTDFVWLPTLRDILGDTRQYSEKNSVTAKTVYPEDSYTLGTQFWERNVNPSGPSQYFQYHTITRTPDTDGTGMNVISVDRTGMGMCVIWDGSVSDSFIPCITVDTSALFKANAGISNTTFHLEGASDYGTEVSEDLTTEWDGTLVFRNIEKGTYTLTETKENPEYIPDYETEYTVIVDANGNARIEKAGEELETKGGYYCIDNVKRYHDFSIRKIDDTDNSWLSGASFRLYGTSNLGTEIDVTKKTLSTGLAAFQRIEAGTYLIKETEAPEHHTADTKTRIVTITDTGRVTISGLGYDSTGNIVWPNERSLDGKIKVTKHWKDFSASNENRPVPKLHLTTEGELFQTQAYAAMSLLGSENPNAIVFFRDEKGKYENGQTVTGWIGSAGFNADEEGPDNCKIFTGFENATYDDAHMPPWTECLAEIITGTDPLEEGWPVSYGIYFTDKISPVSTAHWFDSYYSDEVLEQHPDLLDYPLYVIDDISDLDMSRTVNTSYMFRGAELLPGNEIIFDMGNIENAESMFEDSDTGDREITLRNLKSNVTTNVENMFCGQNNVTITRLCLDGCDLDYASGEVPTMFNACIEELSFRNGYVSPAMWSSLMNTGNHITGVQALDMANFDIPRYVEAHSSVEYGGFNDFPDISNFSYYCGPLTSIDVSGWDLSTTESLNSLFIAMDGIVELDLSTWDTSNISDMQNMFKMCTFLETIYVSDRWSLGSIPDPGGCTGMFTSTKIEENNSTVSPMPGPSLPGGGGIILPGDPSEAYNHATYEPPDGWLTYKEYEAPQPGGSSGGSGSYDPEEGGTYTENYVSNDADWVKNDDDTWTYTFDVYNDEAQFYLYEDVPAGYESSNDINDPLVINEGTITKSGELTNTKADTVSLTVSMTVGGENVTSADRDRPFKFNVSLEVPSGNAYAGTKEYGGVVYKDGKASFTLKDGESKELTGLPAGTVYQVTEEPVEGFTSSIGNSSGTLTAAGDHADVTAVNTKNSVDRVALTITNAVEEDIPLGEEIRFTAELSGLEKNAEYTAYKDGEELSSSMSDASGRMKVSFALADSETFRILGIPAGAKYKVTEEANGYIAKYAITDDNDLDSIDRAARENDEPQTALSTQSETADAGEAVTIAFTNTYKVPKSDPDYTDISFVKKDYDTGEPLSGASFTLTGTSTDGEDIDLSTVTGDDGIVSFKKIGSGTYTLKETRAPEGYTANTAQTSVTVSTHHAIGTVNSIIGAKKSSTPNVSDDGTFESGYEGGKLFSDVVSIPGADRLKVSIRCEAGSGDTLDVYRGNAAENKLHLTGTVQKTIEIEGDTVSFGFSSDQSDNEHLGYIAQVHGIGQISADTFGVTSPDLVRENGVPVIYNTKTALASVAFSKVDEEDTSKTLENARFELSGNGITPDRQVTDADGSVSFGNLANGTYTLREIAAPTGYKLSDKVYTVEVTSPDSYTISERGGNELPKGQTYKMPNTPARNDLAIGVLARGSGADQSDEFDMTITISNAAPNKTYTLTLPGSTQDTITTDADGCAIKTIALKGGQSAAVKALDYGASVAVTQSASRYVASYVSNTGGKHTNDAAQTAIASNVMTVDGSKDLSLTFTNTLMMPLPTGVKAVERMLGLLALILAGLVLVVRRKMAAEADVLQ